MTYTHTQNDFSGIEIKDATGLTVAAITTCTPEFLAQSLAAPDLLEALAGLLNTHDIKAVMSKRGESYVREKCVAAQAAIAKARTRPYIVEQEIGDGWENTWREDAGEHNPDGTPQTFSTLDEAVDAIKNHITDSINAVEAGDMQDSPDPSEFRIVIGGEVYEYTGNAPWDYTEKGENQ